jgi:hypothetical protein
VLWDCHILHIFAEKFPSWHQNRRGKKNVSNYGASALELSVLTLKKKSIKSNSKNKLKEM